MTEPTFYDEIGGADKIRAIVARFYAGVADDDLLRPMYPEEDLGPAEERFFLFLSQYWGGPGTYSEQRGHPRLRMRHSPFVVDEAARDRWLGHFREALDSVHLTPEQDARFWDYVTHAANFMINTHVVPEVTDMQAYVARLKAIPAVLDTAIAQSKLATREGVHAPKFEIERVIAGSKTIVTGATGFIGSALVPALLARGDEVTVLVRNADKARAKLGGHVTAIAADLEAPGPWAESLAGQDAIIHLAGEPIAGKRWDARQKQVIRDSRVEATRTLVEAIAADTH